MKDLLFRSPRCEPTILGGDPSRQGEYEAAAVLAHDRCLIGHAPEVTYEVRSVRVQEEAALAPAGVRTGPPPTPITT